MMSSEFTELEAPAVIHSEDEPGMIVLGRIRFRDDRRSIGLMLEDRRRHVYLVGKTGMGKTTLMQNMIVATFRPVGAFVSSTRMVTWPSRSSD